MPKPPSPIVLVTSNSPSRVPASRVSAWFGPPVVTDDGGAVVGIDVAAEVGIDVAAEVDRHRLRRRVGRAAEPAAGDAGICPVRGPPGGRMMVRSSSSGFMQRSPPWRRVNCVPPAWGRPAWYRTRLPASRCIALKSARGRGLSAIPHPGREPALHTRRSRSPAARSPSPPKPLPTMRRPFPFLLSFPLDAGSRFGLQGLRHPRHRRPDDRRAFALHLGRAFGSEALAAGERAVAVGRDGRHSGPGLAAALIRGLVSTGIDVVDLGPVTTPMLYYVAATRGEHGCSSGIQVTGSHNPKDYNGFKMVLAGRAIYGEDIQRLRRRIEAEDYAEGEGRQASMDILPEYTARIVGDCSLKRPMRIAVDCGSGIAGASAPGGPARPRLQRRGAVLRGRRRLPASPSRPEQAGEPRRPDRRGRRRRRRARPRLRRRRRPARRRHQGRQDHLSRPAADAVRPRRAAAQPRRADPLRRQVLAAPRRR